MKKTLAPILLVMAIGVTACGDDEKSAAPATTTETTATAPAKGSKALTELAETRRLVQEGVEAYAAGKATEATELVTDAYLEHFEFVEHDLDEADHELNETLEHQIREELRGMIRGGATAAEVRDLHAKIERGLDRAERKLKAAL